MFGLVGETAGALPAVFYWLGAWSLLEGVNVVSESVKS